MTVQELLDALATADPTWDVEIQFEDLSWCGFGTRLEDQYAASVRVGKNQHEGVTISTQPEVVI